MPANQTDLTRRRALGAFAALASLSTLPVAQAKEIIKLLVGFPPGGAIDSTARAYADALRSVETMIVENRPGAAGNIAAGALAQSNPDGSTMMFAPVNVFAISQALYTRLPFDTARDFSPVGIVAKFPWGMAVHPDIPASNVNELVSWMKANPGKAFCGMAAVGSEGHLMAYAFGKSAGIDMTFASYRGGAPMAQDLMAGHISMAFDPIVNLAQPHKAGKMKLLAVSSADRAALLPEVPTFTEAGYPEVNGNTWIGVAVRKGTANARIEELAAALSSAAQSSTLRRNLESLGLEVTRSSPKEMSVAIAADSKRYTSLAKDLGLRLD